MGPDYNTEMNLDMISFLKETITVLNTLPRNLNTNDIAIEIDDIPVKWYGEIVGYIAVSEINGNYAFFNPKEKNV